MTSRIYVLRLSRNQKLINMMMRMMIIFVIIMIVQHRLVSGAEEKSSEADGANRRKYFTRHQSKRLSSLHAASLNNTDVDACMLVCLTAQADFICQSFDYDNHVRSCFLFSVSLSDRDVRLIESADKDHYETSYVKAFRYLPKHHLPGSSSLVLPDTGSAPSHPAISVEQCARHCILATQFKCLGFNFRRDSSRSADPPGGTPPPACSLLARDTTGSRTGVVMSETMDYYERLPEGALSSFINYGVGMLMPLTSEAVYDRFISEVDLSSCAELCLNETSFHCASFDYIYEFDKRPPPDPSHAEPVSQSAACQLSRWAAHQAGGLMIDTMHPKRNHYERVGTNLEYFYAVPWAVLKGGDKPKSYQPISIEQCALQCMRESTFICRSFDFKVSDGGSCQLSSASSSDSGGQLDTHAETPTHIHTDTHHFELKPMLECGGVMTATNGELASPNWPQHYFHHERCVWDIRAPPFRVIKLTLTHFDLGDQSRMCSEAADRLIIEEPGTRSYCLQPDTKTITTVTDRLVLRFISDAKQSASGFRAYYTTDWPCNSLLNNPSSGRGEFATPRWPQSYRPGDSCTWRITAPNPGLIVHINVKPLQLRAHPLGHCTAQSDNVRLLDGTATAPVIGQYCGSAQNEVNVRSSGRDLVIQFYSDSAATMPEGRGFHATYWYETANGTIWGDSSTTNQESPYKSPDDFITKNKTIPFTDYDIGLTGAVMRGDSSDGQGDGRGLWAAVVLLLLLVTGLVVALLLVVRYYRQRLAGGKQKQVIVDGELQTLQDGRDDEERGVTELSLTQFSPSYRPTSSNSNNRVGSNGRNSNKQQPFNNLVDLSVNKTNQSQPTNHSVGGAEGGVPLTSSNHVPSYKEPLLAEDIKPAASGKQVAEEGPAPRAPARTRRPLSGYGKYHSDNMRNMNRDTQLSDEKSPSNNKTEEFKFPTASKSPSDQT